jgi:dihydrodiol dehydrogenase / D-xylose 1-dehydrogenase (NADP)
MSLRFGVIGAGRIARTFSEAINAPMCGDALPHAIASREIAKAEAFKDQYGYAKAYGSYEDMLKDPDVDVVYVATPHGLHHRHMMMALDHGKHVLCEKAFTLNAKEAKDVFDKASSENLFVMEAMWTRFLPLIQDVTGMVKDGLIGTLSRMEATFGFKSDAPDTDRLFNMDLGGGALLDITLYPLTMSDIFFGPPDTFEASADMHPSGADITDVVRLFHGSRATTLIHTTFTEDLDNTLVLHGSGGTVTIPTYWGAKKAVISTNDGSVRTIRRPFEANGFEYQIAHVTDMIKAGRTESTVMRHEDTMRIMTLLDAIRESIGVTYPNAS